MLGGLVFSPLFLLTGIFWLRSPARGWRVASIHAALIWGGATMLGTEFLGALNGLRYMPVLLGWIVANVGLLIVIFRAWGQRRATFHGPVAGCWFERGLAAAILSLLLLTLTVAEVAPPNTPDVLSYHLPRQLMWLQQGSLAHFDTEDERALMMPPFAEIVQANALLLAGGDHWANFPQWIGYLLGMIVTSLLAGELHGGRRAQWLAAFAFATLPMAYHQASSAKNDLLVAVWLTILAYFALRLRRLEFPPLSEWIYGGLAAGLAIATKTTALLYIAPIVILLGRPLWFHNNRAIVAAAIALVLFAPHAARNYAHYGTPLGIHPADQGGMQQNEKFTPGAVASNLVRNATLHIVSPWTNFNGYLSTAVEKFHHAIAQDPNDPRTTLWLLKYSISWKPKNELVAGAAALTVLGVVAIIVLISTRSFRGEMGFAVLLMIAGILLVCVSLKWQPWGARLHLPSFMIAAAVVACGFERLRFHRYALPIAAILCLACWLPAAETQQRPLWTHPTIFELTRWQNYFRTRPTDELLQGLALETLHESNAESLHVRNTHEFLYPLLHGFLIRGAPHSRLNGAFLGATSGPADAVLLAQSLNSPLPLYYRGSHATEAYRVLGATYPLGIYVPPSKSRALQARLGMPGWLGWDRVENLRPLGIQVINKVPILLREPTTANIRLHFPRQAASMSIRLEAANTGPARVRLRVLLDGTPIGIATLDPVDGLQAVTLPLQTLGERGVIDLATVDADNNLLDRPPSLIFSAIQIFD